MALLRWCTRGHGPTWAYGALNNGTIEPRKGVTSFGSDVKGFVINIFAANNGDAPGPITARGRYCSTVGPRSIYSCLFIGALRNG